MEHPLRLRAVSTRPSSAPDRRGLKRGQHRATTATGCTQPAAHPAATSARTDDAFPLAVRGANAMAGARPHRAEPGAPRARPTKGGAVRIRIALRDGGGRQCCCSSSCIHVADQQRPCLGAGDPPRGGRLAPGGRRPPCRAHQRQVDVVLTGAQGRADEVTYANAVEAAQQATFYNDLASFQAVAGRAPGEHHPGGMDADRHLRGGRSRTTRTPDTSGSSSGTTSTAIRRPAARRRRCNWPGKRRTVKGRPTHRESATATETLQRLQSEHGRPRPTPLRTWPSPVPCRSSPAMR